MSSSPASANSAAASHRVRARPANAIVVPQTTMAQITTRPSRRAIPNIIATGSIANDPSSAWLLRT